MGEVIKFPSVASPASSGHEEGELAKVTQLHPEKELASMHKSVNTRENLTDEEKDKLLEELDNLSRQLTENSKNPAKSYKDYFNVVNLFINIIRKHRTEKTDKTTEADWDKLIDSLVEKYPGITRCIAVCSEYGESIKKAGKSAGLSVNHPAISAAYMFSLAVAEKIKEQNKG